MWTRVREIWSAAPWEVKALLVLLVLLALFIPRNLIHDFLNDLERKKVAEKAKKLEEEAKVLEHDKAKAEGELDQLKKERDQAAAEAENDDAVDFYNNHNLPNK